MKKMFWFFFFLHIPLLSQESDRITQADQITYEWLVDQGNTTGYTDHIVHFRKIFELIKVRTFLEFGVGFSTKYFLDHCDKVISVEFVTDGYSPIWQQECLHLYQNSSNWVSISYFSGYNGDMNWAPYKYMGSEAVFKANAYQCSTHKNYALIDDFYLIELDAFIKNVFKSHNITITFVDPGIYLRGDLVQLLFNQSPIIIAHDTFFRADGIKDDVYGYSRIATPSNYREIYLPGGQGTTVWIQINDKTQELIQQLEDYATLLIISQGDKTYSSE